MAINQRYLNIANGHMVLTGNTLLIYSSNVTAPGPFITVDTSQQVPGYPAGTTPNWQLNSSMAVLTVPAGATVLYAELTWSSLLISGTADYSAFRDDPVTFITPAGSTTVAPQVTDNTLDIYTRSADVTALVQAGGTGQYTLGGVAGVNGFESAGVSGNAAGWYLSVVLENPAEPSRLFQINVGNAFVPGNSTLDFSIDGFSTPASGPVTGKLFTGIQRGDPVADIIPIFVGPDVANLNYQLTRPPMPPDNMIAGFISNTETGAIIDTSGSFGNNNNIPGNPPVAQPFARWHIDIAAFDISPSLVNNQTTLVTRSDSQAQVAVFDFNVYNVQIDAQAANVTLEKSADKAFAAVGETITYTIIATNNGTIQADDVIVTDIPPAGSSFVPGSVTVNGAPVAGDITQGINIGSIPANGEQAVITFQVVVDQLPVPNPMINNASVAYTFLPLPGEPPISGSAISNDAATQVNQAIISVLKSAAPSEVGPDGIITYTLLISNTGNTAADNVVITDVVPAGTTYVPGSVTGATGTPPTLNVIGSIPGGGSAVVAFQVQVNGTAPDPNPVPNTATANYQFTIDPANPGGGSGTETSNTVTTSVLYAALTTTKSVDKAFAAPGDVLTYTLTIENTGNVAASNVILNDPLPAGTSFVAGSLTGAAGTPPTLTLNAPVAPGGTAVVTYQVLVGGSIPNPNPVLNTASAEFTFTVDPTVPNGETGTSLSNTVNTQINAARLNLIKRTDKIIAYIGDVITYQIAVTNSGNVPANNVVLTDVIPGGTELVPGSLTVSVPYTGTPAAGIQLNAPVGAGETVTLSFQIRVIDMPNPNPIINIMNAAYTYTVDPAVPDGISTTAASNPVQTVVFRNNYSQQITDLINSVSLEQAALANLANAEGAKIQAMVAMENITSQELLCLNKSVADMLDSISMLEAVLRQKLNIVNCQINGPCR